MSSAFSEASLSAYKESGFKKYFCIAEQDERTCSICNALDGEVFDVDRSIVGSDTPPVHPFCRCTTAAYEERNMDEDKELGYNNSELKKITSHSSSQEITKRVNQGKISLISNKEHYEKHVKGTKQYNSYLNSRTKRGWGPQNNLLITYQESQDLINAFSGKGIAKHGKNNKEKWFEEVNVGKVIGNYIINGKEFPTTKIRIYYSKKGTHIIPIRGEDFD